MLDYNTSLQKVSFSHCSSNEHLLRLTQYYSNEKVQANVNNKKRVLQE